VFDKFYRAGQMAVGWIGADDLSRDRRGARRQDLALNRPEGGALFQFTILLKADPRKSNLKKWKCPNDSTKYFSQRGAACQIMSLWFS